MSEMTMIGMLSGAGVLLFLVGSVVMLAQKRWQARLQTQVGAHVGDELAISVAKSKQKRDGGDLVSKLNERVRKLSVIPKLQIDLTAAGIAMPASRFLVLRIIVALFAGVVPFLLLATLGVGLRAFAMVVGMIVGFYFTRVYLRMKRRFRLRKLEVQLPDAIDVLGGALEAGSSLPQSMGMVAREMSDPIATEFSRVVRDQELGLSQQEALDRMLLRCPSEDLDMLFTAINIQSRVGGNLSKVLRSIGFTIRERLRIRGEIKTLTAQGRISAKVIAGLPIALLLLLTLFNWSFVNPLFTTTLGYMMLGAAGIGIVVGYLTMMKIVAIKV
ncbi:MAG: Flp pilus assembly protein TadB [uncultured Chloroflexia bacterium]|uniref:Flp pilus assembly protein TadB n=1 Tax=uncultured Chloroflexia bacterium TaxID=1672391 RepID=A0A6J4J680_9CHLR|nr:MAG: Flp pilus assembly protein TadB [uncultured Chloroflexia bacterium]